MERIINRQNKNYIGGVDTSMINDNNCSYMSRDQYDEANDYTMNASVLLGVPIFKKNDDKSLLFTRSDIDLPDFVCELKTTKKRRWCALESSICFPEKFSILLVDDSHNQLTTITNMLSENDITIVTASDGFQAFELVKAMYQKGYMYMLILMDVYMPNWDGYDGTKMIRNYEEQNEYPRSYIYCVSADDNDLMVSKSKEAKMDNFMIKPISKPNLHKIIINRAEKIGFDIAKLNLN